MPEQDTYTRDETGTSKTPDETGTPKERFVTMLHEGFLSRTVGAWRLELEKAREQIIPEGPVSPAGPQEVDYAA